MKVDLCAELDLLNRNVEEMLRLCRLARDAGVWTRQETQRHTARLESLRSKLNADFQELAALREYADRALERTND